MSEGFATLVSFVPLAMVVAAMLFAFCRICGRLGLSRWLGVLSIIPLLNLAFFLYLAVARWPAVEASRPVDMGPARPAV